MASVEQGLVARLYDSSGITDLIGSGTVFRCLPGRHQQGDAQPSIRWDLLDTQRQFVLSGPTGNATSYFRVDCAGETYDSARALADEVISLFAAYGGSPATGLTFYNSQAHESGYTCIRNPGASDSYTHLLTVEVRVWHDF